MKNVKKTKSIVICLFVFMLSIAFADTAKAETTEYDLYILGERVTSDNMSGDGWRFEPTTQENGYNKLYLTDVNLVVDDDTLNPTADGQAIQLMDNLEIVLSGENTISMNATDTSSLSYYDAIDASNLILSGDGSLTVNYNDYEGNSEGICAIYAGYTIEIESGVEVNIQGMNVSSTEDGYVNYLGLCGDEAIIINSDASVSVSGSGVSFSGADTEARIYGIGTEALTIHDNVKIDVSIDSVEAGNIKCSGIGTDVLTIHDNVKIDVSIDSVEAGGIECNGIQAYESIVVGNEAQISVDMGSMKCENGEAYSCGFYTEYFQIGDNGKITIEGSDVDEDYVEFNLSSMGFVCMENVIGENTTIDASSGENGYVGCLVVTVEIGKDSIIKAYGSQYALVFATENIPQYPIYGGDKATDLNNLIFSEYEIQEVKNYVPFSGDKPAKYVELGELLTINLECDNGTVDKNELSVHNGRAIGTLPTPTRAGYTFTGWYTAASGGSKVTSATKVTKSMTLYARWEVTKPSTMTGFTYSERTSNSVTLKWTKNSSATGYIIQQYKNSGWTTLKRITKNSTVSYKVTGLSASKTYKFKVVPYKTLDGVTVNGGAATKSVKTLPSYTKGFTYSARTAASVTLKWTKNTSADGYVIQQYKSGGWKTIKTITKNSTVSYKVTGLKPSVNYKFRIKAYKVDGDKKLYAPTYSTKSVKTRPSTVKAFSYNARTKTTINLRWNKNTSADGYVIQQYKGGKWTTIKTVTKNSTVNYKVTGLKKGTTYKFRIRAYKMDGSKKLYSLSYTTKNIKTLSK